MILYFNITKVIEIQLFVILCTFQIYVSKKWGFTKWPRSDYEVMRADGRLQYDGVNVQYKPAHGPLSAWCKIQAELAGVEI